MKLKIGGSTYEVQEEKSALSEAVSLNFREMDISPYKVYVIGKTDALTAAELEKADRSLTVDILE